MLFGSVKAWCHSYRDEQSFSTCSTLRRLIPDSTGLMCPTSSGTLSLEIFIVCGLASAVVSGIKPWVVVQLWNSEHDILVWIGYLVDDLVVCIRRSLKRNKNTFRTESFRDQSRVFVAERGMTHVRTDSQQRWRWTNCTSCTCEYTLRKVSPYLPSRRTIHIRWIGKVGSLKLETNGPASRYKASTEVQTCKLATALYRILNALHTSRASYRYSEDSV